MIDDICSKASSSSSSGGKGFELLGVKGVLGAFIYALGRMTWQTAVTPFIHAVCQFGSARVESFVVGTASVSDWLFELCKGGE